MEVDLRGAFAAVLLASAYLALELLAPGEQYRQVKTGLLAAGIGGASLPSLFRRVIDDRRPPSLPPDGPTQLLVAAIALSLAAGASGCGTSAWQAQSTAGQIVYTVAERAGAAVLDNYDDTVRSARDIASAAGSDSDLASDTASAAWHGQWDVLVHGYNATAAAINAYLALVVRAMDGKLDDPNEILEAGTEVVRAWNALVQSARGGPIRLPEVPAWAFHLLEFGTALVTPSEGT